MAKAKAPRPEEILTEETFTTTPEEKKFQTILDKLNKEYGSGTILRVGDYAGINDVEVIDSGSLRLNEALGVGGYPIGRIVEVYGPESSGKTTLCLHAIAESQKKGKRAAVVDMEHALDLNYAKALGVDVDNLYLSQPGNGEEALNIVKALVESNEFGIIVVDSVAALVPKSEAEGEIGDSNVGKQARMISQAMRILSPKIEKSKTLVMFTNQLRMKIGVMFGSPETTAGGEALKYFASIRIDIRKQVLKDGDDVRFGNSIKAKIVKNKVAAPFRIAEFNINYGKGIDRVDEVLNIAVEKNIIVKGGAWYSYGETKVQGEATLKQLLIDNEDFYNEILEKI